MTSNQDQAIWELSRQGLHRLAEEAEAAWKRGQRFLPNSQTRIAREIDKLIEMCNWEVGGRRST